MKDIVYPIFITVSELSDDPFWIHLFEQMSYGICPFGVCIDSNSVYCNFTGKQFIYSYTTKTSDEISIELKELFQQKLDIYSKIDQLSRQHHFRELLQHEHVSWKDIKKKNIKDILLQNYVIHLRHEHGLSIIQTQKLLKAINLALHFKIISTENIEYDSNTCNIVNIKGIDVQDIIKRKYIVISKIK